MKKIARYTTLVLMVAAGLIVLSKPTYAYLDPGTGSYIIQILIATLAGGTYLVITSWSKVKTFLSNLFNKLSKREDEEDK